MAESFEVASGSSSEERHGMIYYFSGTGNSRWIAEELAKRTSDRAQNIADLVRDGSTAVYAGTGSSIGVVFPVYAWGAPGIVERFCRSIKTENGAYTYAVCTCGDEAGCAMLRLKRFFPLDGAWSFVMPNNYIPGFDVDDPELERRKISAAGERLAHVSESIRQRKREYDVHEGSAAGIKTAVVHPLFQAFARGTKPFYTTAACNGCTICANECPTGTIKMREGKPVWEYSRCEQCMRCINLCPRTAIQYGKATIRRGRYHFTQP